MHYVKLFNINGVDTKQVACIELQGVPNAATEGAVGVLGMDMTSPTHEVYRCVAVNGSVYTWELLSAGMSIICATISGEGAITQDFGYADLKIPNNYLIKAGDLILDTEGYLYQIESIGGESCTARYSGTHLGGSGVADKDYRLVVENGHLQLVTGNGNIVSEIDHIEVDDSTLLKDPQTGKAYVMGVKTVNGTLLRFFVGTEETYNTLTEAQKDSLFAIFTDDKAKERIDKRFEDIEDGNVSVGKARSLSLIPTLNSAKKLVDGKGIYLIYIGNQATICNMGLVYWLGESTYTVTYAPTYVKRNGNTMKLLNLSISVLGILTITETNIDENGASTDSRVTDDWDIYTVKVGEVGI